MAGSGLSIEAAQIDDLDSRSDKKAKKATAVPAGPSCLLTRRIRDHRVNDAGELEFRVNANSYVRAHFDKPCDGLKRRSLIRYRSTGSKLCRGDRVEILASLGDRADVTDICFISGFSDVER